MKDQFESPSYPPPHTVPNPPPPISTEQQEAKQSYNTRAFCNCNEHPADIMNNAASVIHFLEDICLSMIEIGGDTVLSNKGMNGLCIIYQTLGETIRAAIEASNEIENDLKAATDKKEVFA